MSEPEAKGKKSLIWVLSLFNLLLFCLPRIFFPINCDFLKHTGHSCYLITQFSMPLTVDARGECLTFLSLLLLSLCARIYLIHLKPSVAGPVFSHTFTYAETLNHSDGMYWFPAAALTYHHVLGGLRQHTSIPLHCWRPDVPHWCHRAHIQGVAGLWGLWSLEGRGPFLAVWLLELHSSCSLAQCSFFELQSQGHSILPQLTHGLLLL